MKWIATVRMKTQPVNLRGFTLIEILIVIFIMGIVTSVAMLAIRENQTKQIDMYADALQQTLALAEETAILQPALIGLNLYQNMLHLLYYQSEQKKWVVLRDHFFKLPFKPAYLQIELKMSPMPTANKVDLPQIIFAKDGSLTPFELKFAKRGQATLITIEGERNGSIHKIAA